MLQLMAKSLPDLKFQTIQLVWYNRGGGAGCAGCAIAHPIFGLLVRKMKILRTQYLGPILYIAHPILDCFHRHCRVSNKRIVWNNYIGWKNQ